MASPDEIYDQAIQLQQSGKLDEAISMLNELVAEYPDFALAHAGLSVFYGKVEQHEEAVKHAQKVCELEPDDPFSHMAMSIVCQKAGKLPEAERAMSQAMETQWAAVKRSEK